jgi:hypothetical protein
LSSPAIHVRSPELTQLRLNPIMSNVVRLFSQTIKRRREVILIPGLPPERLGDRVLGGPTDRGEVRSLSGYVRQDHKQDEVRPALRPQHPEQRIVKKLMRPFARSI